MRTAVAPSFEEIGQLALAITAVGVVAAAVALVSSGSWRVAIGVLAELLTAGGLVRLSAEPQLEPDRSEISYGQAFSRIRENPGYRVSTAK